MCPLDIASFAALASHGEVACKATRAQDAVVEAHRTKLVLACTAARALKQHNARQAAAVAATPPGAAESWPLGARQRAPHVVPRALRNARVDSVRKQRSASSQGKARNFEQHCVARAPLAFPPKPLRPIAMHCKR